MGIIQALEKFDGQRLAYVRAEGLRVTCRCGHAEELDLSELVATFGVEPRVRTIMRHLACAHCGQKAITCVERIGMGVLSHAD